ncbi:metallophosphoesterase family protein [Catellatospora tritici]|uniref:metallophosphoesterase family protein n=1 Tax=Catellatospora tritici TaxID=2851566 RepID=UPI001C2D69D3|nr:metallophosphoesterase [Catellatospora tritici]MBV1854947.1 metallophosphoesterase [Catellatospora tritici]
MAKPCPPMMFTLLGAGLLALTAVPAAAGPDHAKNADVPAVLVGAGDIGSCASDGDEITAKLLDRIPGTVFTLGDNAYVAGTAAQFQKCYEPYWGRHRDRTRPTIGNHDSRTDEGDPYYDYFGKAAGPKGKGWYSYELNGWQVLVLNSTCDLVDCDADSEQLEWLADELSDSDAKCQVAMFHHPYFTSGSKHHSEPRVKPFWDVLYKHGVDVVLNGHNHNYERFAPQNPDGKADADGIAEFIVGTGGGGLNGFGHHAAANSQARDAKDFGVLKLSLHEDGYDWKFVAQPGSTFTDTGSADCH